MKTPEEIADDVAADLMERRGSVTGTEREAATEGARRAIDLMRAEQ